MLIVPMLLATAACGARREADPNSAEPAPDGAQVRVYNGYTLSVDVIAILPAGTVRMGTVTPGMRATFPLSTPSIRNGVVEIVIRSGGGATVRSGVMDLQPGQVVEFDVGTQFVNSSATVR